MDNKDRKATKANNYWSETSKGATPKRAKLSGP